MLGLKAVMFEQVGPKIFKSKQNKLQFCLTKFPDQYVLARWISSCVILWSDHEFRFYSKSCVHKVWFRTYTLLDQS